ncbi:tyrosine-type recombinase/integrase [Ruegeria sp. R14_0]|uniref:tyrosine-type recombinase/integrase n=1 Tax=Ruegeria sp. R14_0 TaxID=2821100 RepID=UPI001ADC3BB9|nr:tyrosine-type recombinase/integrase [Ruegeria sp. R14_0]MBO9445965.1 tyrosine-type recombinase/integrase [Ruegeria sp. R14_0]
MQDREIFKSLLIPEKGKDRKNKLPYTNVEVRLIQRACFDSDDDVRWIVAILSDTGMRMAEAVAIRVEDLVLDGQYPHVILKEFEVRSLKTAPSTRLVLLVGTALWAAKRAQKGTNKGFLFPRYINLNASPPENLAVHASNTINKWLDGLQIEDKDKKTSHCLRHSMQDRLREAEVPQEIRNSILGWTNKGTGACYGTGFSIRVLHEHMSKVVGDVPIRPQAVSLYRQSQTVCRPQRSSSTM